MGNLRRRSTTTQAGNAHFRCVVQSDDPRSRKHRRTSRRRGDGGNALIAQDGELADSYMRGSEDLASLNPQEFVRFNMTLYNVFTNFGVALHLHQQGMIEDRLLRDFEDGLLTILGQAGVVAWWMTDDAKLMLNWGYIERRRVG